MKKMMMVWIAVAALAANALAQKNQENTAPRGRGNKAQQQASFEKLHLTDVQQDQLQKLRADYRNQMKALRQNESITVKEQRDRSEALRKTHRSQMENLLTAEQKRTLTEQRKNNRQQASQRSKEQRQKMEAALNLTPAQVSTLEASRQQTRDKMKAILKNEQLDRSARNAEIKALRQQSKASIENVLTPQQLAQWNQMRQQHLHNGRGKMRARMGHQGS
jgi:Spy/CpxP family protein refolding chaperone